MHTGINPRRVTSDAAGLATSRDRLSCELDDTLTILRLTDRPARDRPVDGPS